MFASKTPRDLNHDPEPWVDGHGVRYTDVPWDLDAEDVDEDPRPEFDHVPRPGANEPNPILTEIRNEMSEGYPLDTPRELAWLARGDLYWGKYPEGAREHARRVLERLARLAALEG